MKSMPRALRPRFVWPLLGPQTPGDSLALWTGTGLGIGFLKPASATWGSLVGLVYLALWARLPGMSAQLLVQAEALVFSVWAAGRCEWILHTKDPHPVVIDEIVSLPFAFWPILHDGRWWVWAGAFVIFRAADVLKPWPAWVLEKWPAGLGIVADDVVSSVYAGLLIWGGEAVLTAWL